MISNFHLIHNHPIYLILFAMIILFNYEDYLTNSFALIIHLGKSSQTFNFYLFIFYQ